VFLNLGKAVAASGLTHLLKGRKIKKSTSNFTSVHGFSIPALRDGGRIVLVAESQLKTVVVRT
jgi:hypothetical protein